MRNQKSSIPRAAIIVAGGLLVFAIAFFLFRGEPWGLPAIPRDPRPATLSPDHFTGKVKEAYRIAKVAPELLEQMPCYCGCYMGVGHRNNLDCYTERMVQVEGFV